METFHQVQAPATTSGLTVLAIGGSVARGWNDKSDGGYLARALSSVSSVLQISITLENKSVGGFKPADLANQFPKLLRAAHPDVVMVSWGLLNDISGKTPLNVLQEEIRSEVALAAKSGAQVWVITPPVTPSTYVGPDKILEEQYARAEILGARAVGDTEHVHVFDLLNGMKRYLKAHHESYVPYSSNGWHPNTAGHILAGQLLATAILNRASALGLTH